VAESFPSAYITYSLKEYQLSLVSLRSFLSKGLDLLIGNARNVLVLLVCTGSIAVSQQVCVMLWLADFMILALGVKLNTP
jgi:flagellar biosynthesis component FlhA